MNLTERINPRPIELVSLLASAGSYAIPPFQRGSVWDSNGVRRLLESLQRGYFVGSVLVWQPIERAAFSGLDGLEPLHGEPTAKPEDLWLVVDGQQRLRALVEAFLIGGRLHPRKHIGRVWCARRRRSGDNYLVDFRLRAFGGKARPGPDLVPLRLLPCVMELCGHEPLEYAGPASDQRSPKQTVFSSAQEWIAEYSAGAATHLEAINEEVAGLLRRQLVVTELRNVGGAWPYHQVVENYRRLNTFRMVSQWALSALKFLCLWLGVTTLLRYPTYFEVRRDKS